MPVLDRASGFLELARPGNAIAAGVLTFTGAFVASATIDSHTVASMAAAVLATVFATGAGNAINDYFDRDIDRVNRPDRPIPRKAVSEREALGFSAFLFVAAVAVALLLPPVAIAIAAINLGALLAYTEFFKGLPGVGNVVVAYLTGSTFLFGGAAVGATFGAVTLAVLAGVATFTREVVKDVEDVAGDREEGLRTLPIVVGERAALWVGAVTLVVATTASVVPFVIGQFGVAYLLVVLPADLLMLYATVRSFEDPGVGQRRLKHGMLLATLAFVVGRTVAVFGPPASLFGV